MHIRVVRELLVGAAVASSIDLFVGRQEVLIDLDSLVQVILNACFFKAHPFDVGDSADCKEDCLNFDDALFSLMVKDNLNRWESILLFRLAHLLELLRNRAEKQFNTVFNQLLLKD